MKLQSGDYFLNADQYCFWLSKKTKSEETGKTSIRRITGYRTNFDDLMADFVRKQISGDEVESVKELIEIVKKTFADAEALKKTALENDFKVLRKVKKGGKVK